MSSWTQLTPSIYHRLAFGSAYGLTDIGLVRTANEDNFLIDQQGWHRGRGRRHGRPRRR